VILTTQEPNAGDTFEDAKEMKLDLMKEFVQVGEIQTKQSDVVNSTGRSEHFFLLLLNIAVFSQQSQQFVNEMLAVSLEFSELRISQPHHGVSTEAEWTQILASELKFEKFFNLFLLTKQVDSSARQNLDGRPAYDRKVLLRFY
jgi:hypothetical protein